jgi:hypothetical protein
MAFEFESAPIISWGYSVDCRAVLRKSQDVHTVGWMVWSMMNQGLRAAHERLYRLSFVEIAG